MLSNLYCDQNPRCNESPDVLNSSEIVPQCGWPSRLRLCLYSELKNNLCIVVDTWAFIVPWGLAPI